MTPAKKTKEATSESNKDGVAYQCLLKNELLGAGIEEQSEERKIFLPLESKNLFRVSIARIGDKYKNSSVQHVCVLGIHLYT